MYTLALTAAVAYFVESIFGFGGTVLLVAFGSFQLDFKALIYISIWCSTLASVVVLCTGYRAFSWLHLRRIMLLTLPGLVLGTWLLSFMSGTLLLTIFAGLMLLYALQGLLYPTWQPPGWLGQAFVAAGGVVQGLYSTGGPFVVAGYRTQFSDKSQLRAVMAGFFLIANILRVGQISLSGDTSIFTVLHDYWLVLLGVPIAVWLGHHIHLRLSEKQFRIGLLSLILLVSLFHLVRSLL